MRFPLVIKTVQRYTDELAEEFSAGYHFGQNDGVQDENERLRQNHAEWLRGIIENLSKATSDYIPKANNAFLTSAKYIFKGE